MNTDLQLNTNNKSTHNYGIDLLRLLAMFMVVVLHIVNYGGVLNTAQGDYCGIAMLFMSITFCSANCFAIISGFVGYTEMPKPFRMSKYIHLWFWVFFYSFGIALVTNIISCVSGNGFSLHDIVCHAFPVVNRQYWYFTAYTVLFFLMPMLNSFVRVLSEKRLTKFVLAFFLIFSLYGTVSALIGNDAFVLGNGYSAIWLAYLYFVGAWIKKNKIADKIKTWYAVFLLLPFNLINYVLIVFSNETLVLGIFTYVNPLLVGIAICWVVIFSKMKFRKSTAGMISFFAPSAFGVYLLHTQDYIWNAFIVNQWMFTLNNPIWLFPFIVLGWAFVIFAVSIVIDKIRFYLFELIRVQKMSEKISRVIEKIISRFVEFFEE